MIFQGNVKIRLDPIKKIPLSPPSIKGGLRFTPLKRVREPGWFAEFYC